jgi:type VI protein secretion system component VasF
LTQSTPPSPPPPDHIRQALLERLRQTTPDAVGKAAASAEGLSEEDAERLKRRTRHHGHETRAKIRRAFSWFLFGSACVFLTVTLIGFFWLLWRWIGTFWDDAAKLGGFLGVVVTYVLVVLATLFVEGVLRSRDED